MAKRTYSIRKGFEFQDMFCAIQLMEAIKANTWGLRFQMESDEVHHLDDLVLDRPNSVSVGYQVKYHVTHGEFYSFDAFLTKRTPKSRSLLQKLYDGWADWNDRAANVCELEFITTSFAEPGKENLGAMIMSANGRFADAFFDKPNKNRDRWTTHLGIEEGDLRRFLSHTTWRFGYGSLSDLQYRFEQLMEQCRLPQGEDAISAVLDVVAHYALHVPNSSDLKHFVKSLWERPILRDACEKLLDEDDIPAVTSTRASHATVAMVKLDCLPAFACRDYVCLEEPLPLGENHASISNPFFGATFDSMRSKFLDEYLNWQKRRLETVLEFLERHSPDLIVFPRYSIPPELAGDVAEWCRDRSINIALGGHTQPDATGIELHYSRNLALLPALELSNESEEGTVIDSLIRAGRAGRYSLSQTTSPNQRQETLLTTPVLEKLFCASGWLNVLLLPSAQSLSAFASSNEASPDLIVVSCNMHEDRIYDQLKSSAKLHNTPLIVCSQRTAHPIAEILSKADPPVPAVNSDWEGVSIARFSYNRTVASRWNATIDAIDHFPIVYHNGNVLDDSQTMRGLSRSVSAAKGTLSDKHSMVLVSENDPHSFFVNREREASAFIRSILSDQPIDQLTKLTETLKLLEKRSKERSTAAEISIAVATALSHSPKVRRRPPLVDRTQERRDLSRFLDGTSTKRLFFLFGTSGVGKRSLVNDISRTHPHRRTWLRFQCLENASVGEILAQLLTVLDENVTEVPSLTPELYQHVCRQLKASTYTHCIIEGAHNLPLRSSDSEHPALMAFLSALVNSNIRMPILLISDSKADLEFSGKHLIVIKHLRGLSDDDTVHLLQELIADIEFSHSPPDTEDLANIARSIHGMPLLAEIVASIVECTPVDELVGALHKHERVRRFVIDVMLGRGSCSPAHDRFLMLAAITRTAIPISAFIPISGAQSRRIADELNSRFLLTESDGMYSLHPLLADYYRHLIPDDDFKRKLHKTAFKYYDHLWTVRQLTIEEKGERVFHAFRSGSYLRLEDLKLFTGPIRRAMFEGLKARNWDEVKLAAGKILEIFPSDALARTSLAVALDATGCDSDLYFDSVSDLDFEDLWVGIELARSKIRRHDFQRAEYLLSELRQRFATNNRVEVASAQLDQAKGNYSEAIDKCRGVLASDNCHPSDAFSAGLVLLSSKRLDLLVDYVNTRLHGKPRKSGLARLYAFGSVITNYAPDQGLSTLANMWQSHPYDAHVAHDYALALCHLKRFGDAQRVLDKSLKNRRWVRGHVANVYEAYAHYWDARHNFRMAHEHYRKLLKMRPYDTHVYRMFASSLIEGAKEAKASQNLGVEQACAEEAKHVLENLLEITHEDIWAADQLHRVSTFNY